MSDGFEIGIAMGEKAVSAIIVHLLRVVNQPRHKLLRVHRKGYMTKSYSQTLSLPYVKRSLIFVNKAGNW